VRAELINLPGLTSIRYEAEQDIFVIGYRPDRVQVADMFSAIWAAGLKQGREFVPEVVEGGPLG
jgi:hypothetical protein